MKPLIFLLLLMPAIASSRNADSIDTRLPHSVTEAHDSLLIELPQSVLNKMRAGSEEDMILYHFSLGMWIRNTWGLWKNNSGLARFFDSAGVHHPDAMSSIILETFWCRLNDKPLALAEHITKTIQKEIRFQTPIEFMDSTCSIDGSKLTLGREDQIEKIGPPYKFLLLLTCKKHHHRWVGEHGRPLYKPDQQTLDEFASKIFLPRSMFEQVPKKKIRTSTPVPAERKP